MMHHGNNRVEFLFEVTELIQYLARTLLNPQYSQMHETSGRSGKAYFKLLSRMLNV